MVFNTTTARAACPSDASFCSQYELAKLGVAYFTGEGVTQDNREAVRWYQKTAKQGDAWAQFNLGRMYANGEGLLPMSAMHIYVVVHCQSKRQ